MEIESEYYFHGHRHTSRVAYGAENLPKARITSRSARHESIGQRKVGMVQGIKSLSPELDRCALVQRRVEAEGLEQRHVGLEELWSVPQIAPAVPECSRGGRSKRCRVNPVSDTRVGPVGISDTIRPLERSMRPIGSVGHNELHR